MIRIPRWTAALAAVCTAVLMAAPASAQYANEFSPAKLVHQATTTVPIAGSGTVVIQVEVFSNGSHHVVRIIRSTNHGDDAAARDIAQNSTYRPQHRGTKAVTGFYDFTIKFHGKGVSSYGSRSGAVFLTGGAASVDKLIRSGKYAAAKARAESMLASHPNDPVVNQELGAADFFLNDYADAAAAFDKVPAVSHAFLQVAAQSYVLAALHSTQTNPAGAVAFAQKAVALQPNTNAYFALGSAELATDNAAAAVGDLKKARDLVMADPKADAKTKATIDTQLLAAYLKSGDQTDAAPLSNEIRQLDPNSSASQTILGNQYIAQGNTASKNGNHAEAIVDYEQAAKVGSPQVAVTAYAAAALEENSILQAQKNAPTASDYGKVKAYADKALALNANDALANFAEGVALAGQYLTGGKTDNSLKTQALATLNKAKAAAQAAGNISLSINIDNFIKQTFK